MKKKVMEKATGERYASKAKMKMHEKSESPRMKNKELKKGKKC
jgi:hypothetical protein